MLEPQVKISHATAGEPNRKIPKCSGQQSPQRELQSRLRAFSRTTQQETVPVKRGTETYLHCFITKKIEKRLTVFERARTKPEPGRGAVLLVSSGQLKLATLFLLLFLPQTST